MKLKTLTATNTPAVQPQLKMCSMPANDKENKCLSSAHRRNSGTNMHRAKTSAKRGEQPGTYHCAAPMLVYASITLPAAGAALCIAGCSIVCATLTPAMQRLMP